MFMFDTGGLETILVLKGGIGLVDMLKSIEQPQAVYLGDQENV